MKKVKLSIVIHTEEEFDWAGGFNRHNTSVTHGKELTEMCVDMLKLGCCITFAMDWSFVTSEQGQNVIRFMQENYTEQVEFAAHLHPWVNPPFDEQYSDTDNIDEKLSYPGNLPAELEKAKLAMLTDKIAELTGRSPTTYLAGRYGVGENTYKILSELGYKVDVSISPFADFRHQDGPDFSNKNNASFTQNGIKCIPHSSGYISHIGVLADWLNRDTANLHNLNNNVVGKVILKLLGVERVRLSPEGFDEAQMKKLVASLTRTGVEHLIYSFHSSTSKLGGSPYVETKESVQQMYKNNSDILTTITSVTTPSLFADLL
ncbi:WalW protein [Brumicola nitratireducens]|uniref:WalW protein n=1 Tax=Glaciecola nitratireducens (strain JCM 12485 / KCTC 12276 / FR1064) TaxID=1085623 RepID=G4QM65_GLANF|nr:WalW protein [Glaciecola nitratireducens]AEP30636.1 WalW protein [Glaciecola nitratireducens FR1064]